MPYHHDIVCMLTSIVSMRCDENQIITSIKHLDHAMSMASYVQYVMELCIITLLFLWQHVLTVYCVFMSSLQ